MGEREWYLDVGGKKAGPYSVQEIVQMVSKSQVDGRTRATTARLKGDWIDVSDLTEAYRELTHKPEPQITYGAQFQAPPMPIEEIEHSRLIQVQTSDDGPAPDATDGLFATLQAVREKAAKTGQLPPSVSQQGVSHEGFVVERRGSVRVSSQAMVIFAIIGILGISGYAFTKLKKRPPMGMAPDATIPVTAAPPPPSGGGQLLSNTPSARVRNLPGGIRVSVPGGGVAPPPAAASRADEDFPLELPPGGEDQHFDEPTMGATRNNGEAPDPYAEVNPADAAQLRRFQGGAAPAGGAYEQGAPNAPDNDPGLANPEGVAPEAGSP